MSKKMKEKSEVEKEIQELISQNPKMKPKDLWDLYKKNKSSESSPGGKVNLPSIQKIAAVKRRLALR
jgi:hypothetical protein